jgi:hypothetical protein
VVELPGLSRETNHDVAKALAVGQLSEGHCPVLLGAGQDPHPIIPALASNNTVKSCPWEKIHDLSEKRLAGVHRHLQESMYRQLRQIIALRSSRNHPEIAKTLLNTTCCKIKLSS